MSFAEQLCAELLELPLKKPCCRRALSAGLLLGGERVSGSLVKLRLHREAVAVMAVALLERPMPRWHKQRSWDTTGTVNGSFLFRLLPPQS